MLFSVMTFGTAQHSLCNIFHYVLLLAFLNCNGHTVNTWLTPSLLGLQYQSIVDLRSCLQVQLNQLRIMVSELVRYPSRVTLPLPRFF